ncbi:hypothetical protein KEM55_002239, partial [Ascosphaera atra]
TVGPLHGLPVSLKDCFKTPPYPSSIGLAKHANVPTEREALLVTALKNLGAVFFVKTNVPTSMMLGETINNVWGETRKPVHEKLSAGGSYGGEAAILAMHAAPLGVGTDIGGSIRISCGFNGLYGLKPSFGWTTTAGNQLSLPGQDFVYGVGGPMSTSLDAIRLFCGNVCSAGNEAWDKDPKPVPLPWRKGAILPKGRKLRFGIVTNSDGS